MIDVYIIFILLAYWKEKEIWDMLCNVYLLKYAACSWKKV